MKVIAISSFKGGTAKTSTALHLGAALARFHGKRVLLIDFDAQANLTSGLGFDADSLESMACVLLGQKQLKEVIQKTSTPKLHLVPADIWLERVELSGSLAADRYSHERLKHLLQKLQNSYDFVIIDTPPSLCWLTESALIAATDCLICATPEFYSVKGLQRLAQFLRGISDRHGMDILGVCLSFWNPRGKNNKAFIQLIEQNFVDKLLKSKVRRDAAVSEAAIVGRPVFETHPASRAAQDLQALTEEILARSQSQKRSL